MSRLRSLGLAAKIALGAAVVLVLAQAVPYGRDHADPSPTRELRFDSATTERLFSDACGDCHSDHTEWPWYSNVAPVSWLVQDDVDGGRNALNVSRWDQPQPEADEIAEVIAGGGMPPIQYKLIHGAARLDDAEKRQLEDGLMRSIAADPPG